MKSDKRAVLNRNDSSKHREVGDRMLANKFKDKQSNIETDFWWLNLPYVLVRDQNSLHSTSLYIVMLESGCAIIADVRSILFSFYMF